MKGPQDILLANAEFYRAFAEGDAAAMERIWAAEAPLACIHPGWRALIGREAVLKSWRQILEDPPPIVCEGERVFYWGKAMVVLCEEVIGESRLAATNVFVEEEGHFRLVHHQATPMALPGGAGEMPSRGLH